MNDEPNGDLNGELNGDDLENVLNDALNALCDPERRALLYALEDDSTISVDPDALGSGEHDLSVDEVSLRHRHLPKLEDTGLVSYDEDGALVECTALFEELRPLIESLHEYEDSYD